MKREEFLRTLIKSGALQFGDFSLASGKKSTYYIDVKVAVTKPELLKAIAEFIAPKTRGCARIAGVELGAVPIAAAVSLQTGLPFIMVRKEAKEHGTRKPFEGEMKAGDRVLFVEDVVTTAGTLSRHIEVMRQQGAIIDLAVAVVDREEGGEENLRRIGVKLDSILKAKDILEASR